MRRQAKYTGNQIVSLFRFRDLEISCDCLRQAAKAVMSQYNESAKGG